MKCISPMRLKQRGSMLVISLFIIIVMTILGLTMTVMLSAASDSVINEVYGLRAQHAARTGLERHLLSVFPTNGTANIAACNNQTYLFTNIGGLENCHYRSVCNHQNYILSTGEAASFSFTSTGQCQAGDMLVSRTISVDALERQ